MEPALQDLWRSWYDDRTKINRANLTEEYLPLVKRIAHGFGMTEGFFDRDDLTSSGVIGLMDAIDRYDPAFMASFETYGATRIRGEMVDALRAVDWVPRSVRRKAKALEVAREEGRDAGSEPSHADMADTMHLSGDEFAGMLAELDGVRMLSLDVPSVGENAEASDALIGDSIDPIDITIVASDVTTLNTEMSWLTAREQGILHDYYWDEHTLAEIGLELGVTESRVSQIRTGAQRTLKAQLTVAWRMG